ncbi:TDP-N-acetylfucosamine:lipid II N-acetylfucosaminyltransferase [Pseudoalteromonas sp. JB197]|uniref:TDP-N-acetylfucosamine:lipid II N-acetylfucosaminyltransferase n=1 Tax=Pseudoalteromonas sp. JB197 TaxID=1434839 RepID=UPI00097F3A5F|nr:TDP-N-acetylfucosamine:lipid II N-acetylfucosaminyltransferase [Pseudoalteromonas sp. JB197]PCC11828.1 hypothetical protein CIK86_00130 [Pseudoalteromonas sp. JB197]SJN46478.1 4-alpha-L-fucosyltransferase [Pseudoalteromonas sp. JB197]
MKNILHLSADEKFIDMGISAFEMVYPASNTLLVVQNHAHIKHVNFKNKKIISKKKLASDSKKDTFWLGVDAVVLHSIFAYTVNIPKNIRVIWLGFGYDYYDFIFKNEFELFSQKSLQLMSNKQLMQGEGFIVKLKNAIKLLIFFKYRQKKQKIKIMERVDIFCPVLTSEYQAIKWPGKNTPKLMDWNYGTMEDNWAKENANVLSGKNILLGNSATLTCNHLDGIDLLCKAKNIGSKLIIPLSYGNKKYGELVKKYAHQHFSGEVLALDGFMPFDEYMQLISSCSFVIMPHKRQQGVGNIIALLNLGAKVFLDKRNLLYTFLKEKGFFVFCLEDIVSPDFLTELTQEQIEKNKIYLYEIWGRDSILNKTKMLIECPL